MFRDWEYGGKPVPTKNKPRPQELRNCQPYFEGDHFASEPFSQAFALQGASNRLSVSSRELPTAEIASWLMKV